MYRKNTSSDPQTIEFRYEADRLFDTISMQTQFRAKNITNENNQDFTDRFGVTEDERRSILNFLQYGAYDVFKEVLKLTKGVSSAIDVSDLQYEGETKLEYSSGSGVPFEYGEKITGSSSGAEGYVAEDRDGTLIVTKVTGGPFTTSDDITGDEGASATVDSVSTIDNAVLSFKILDNKNYKESLLGVIDNNIKEALILYALREWWHICGLAEEYKNASTLFNQELVKLNNNLFELKKPTIV